MHNLMGHMHLHSDNKPFKCLYCPSKFTLKGNLTRHMKVKHGIMDRGLDARGKEYYPSTDFRSSQGYLFFSANQGLKNYSICLLFEVFRRRGRLCLSSPLRLLSRFNQDKPFDLSQKRHPQLRLSQSDGESREEDEDSLYRMSQYSPDRYQTELGGAREADDEDEEEDGMVHEEVDERSGKQFNLSKEDFQCIRYRDSQQGSVSDGELYCSRTYRDRKLSCE